MYSILTPLEETIEKHHSPNTTQAVFRLCGVAFLVASGILIACFFPLLKHATRKDITRGWSRLLLKTLGIRLYTQGHAQHEAIKGRLVLANHVSWLDIIAMNAVMPARFVAKSEVQAWPVIGWLCERAGTLFIDRTNRRDAARVNSEIVEALRQNDSVALFPEGTSTDGTELLNDFRSPLLQSAIEANVSICPVAVRYHDPEGLPNLDAAFVGDMSFTQSLWQIALSANLCASLFYLPPQPAIGKSRRLLAMEAQAAIHTTLARYSPYHSIYVPRSVNPAKLAA
jgi:1-acyl-sn-glycerol-3-phosphate acyltransferase